MYAASRRFGVAHVVARARLRRGLSPNDLESHRRVTRAVQSILWRPHAMSVAPLVIRCSGNRRLASLCAALLCLLLAACGADKKVETTTDTTAEVDAGGDVEVPIDVGPDVSWTGKCAAGPAFCDDSNPCTIDDCDPQTGCTTTAKDCTDEDECTLDACNVADGTCTHVLNTCDDGNDCTAGSCKSGEGCVYTAKDCSDGDKCTADGCSPLKGCLNTELDCDDDITCTVDKCDPAVGCVHSKPPGATCCESPSDSEDDNACTVHACTGGVCQSTAVFGCCKENADCSDVNP